MKRCLAVFVILALVAVAFFSCTPASSAGNGSTLSLSYSATLAGWAPAVSGGAVGVAANATGGSRAASVVTFSSPDTTVVQAPTATAVSAAVNAPAGSVALLNTETGYITPLGSVPATITIKATDASGNSTSVQVTTSVVAFADTTAVGRKWTISSCTSANVVDGETVLAYMTYQGQQGSTPVNVFFWSMRANQDDSLSAYPSKTYAGGLEPLTIGGVQYEVANQLNAGYMVTCNNPGIDFGWVAIDGHAYAVGMMSGSGPTYPLGTKENPFPIAFTTGLTTFTWIFPAVFTTTWNFDGYFSNGAINPAPITGGITQDVTLTLTSN